jgi:hypothetical protein
MTPFAAQLPSGVTARPLNDRDLAAVLTLSAEAGWNQTAAGKSFSTSEAPSALSALTAA